MSSRATTGLPDDDVVVARLLPSRLLRQPNPRRSAMSLPAIVSRGEWVAARKRLLVKEKELTRQRDVLNTERRKLPMVEITKDYTFAGPHGPPTSSTSSRGGGS
jgi:hypothetical protein